MEMTHKGMLYVSILKNYFFDVCYLEDIYEGIFTDKMLYELPFEYKQFQKLLGWKFDVFGLIELGLAEPVTEDFNPYK